MAPEVTEESGADSDESEEVYSRCSSAAVQHTGYTAATHSTEGDSHSTRIAVAAAVAAVFVLVQAVGSWLSGSVAVLYDSSHLLCDSFGLLAVLAAAKTARKLPSECYTFGYLRAEVVGCLATLQLMWVVTAMLVYESAVRVESLQYAQLDPDLMIVSALLGFAGYLALILILRGGIQDLSCDKSPHSQSYSKSPHSQCYSKSHLEVSDQTTPFLESTRVASHPAFLARVARLHVYGDAVMAACVLVSALVIRVQPAWKLLDPVLTILGGGAVVACTLPLLRDTLLVLQEGCPAHVSVSAVQAELESIQGVQRVQSVQVWALNFSVCAACVQLVVDRACDQEAVQQRVVLLLRRQFSVQWCTVQVQRQAKSVLCTTLMRKTEA